VRWRASYFPPKGGCFVSRENYTVIVIPAIDIRDGKCVRLLQGDFDRTTVYSDDPVDMAKKWQAKGAARIHVVDLDGSRTGRPQNREVIERIAREIDVPLQVGGGIRDIETVSDYIGMGVGYCIVGTVALKDRDFVIEACQRFSDSLILGIDARDGKVAVEGWIERSMLTPLEIAKSYEGCGLAAIVYTDIGRDGMETGVNIDATKELAESVNIPIIASGGVSGIDDIEKLIDVEKSGIMGVITGKALYEGTLALEEAVARTRMAGH
jgi:phosphoribosylformimino-5-aminoimidazole carboxamide ribotide isomerase